MRTEGDVVTWRGLQGDAYQRGRNFVTPVMGWKNSQGEGRRIVAGAAGKLWPLAPGKSARFSVITESRGAGAEAWERNLALWSCHVDPARTVETPAGSFEVLPIACDRFSPVNMRLLERLTWDYAPEVGHYVRRTIVDYLAARTSVTHSSMLTGAIRKVLMQKKGEFDPRAYLKPAKEAMRAVCQARFEQFGAAGWAGKVKPISTAAMAKRYLTGELNPKIGASKVAAE